jgi:hypothetical protein
MQYLNWKSIMLQRYLILLVFSITLAGCSIADRPPYSSEMDVVIRESTLSEVRWHVPAGEVIQVQLSNQAAESHTWSILTPVSTGKTGTAWFSQEVHPGETLKITFTAPAAPGEYDVVSVGTETKTRLTAEIVVVQP